MDLNEGINKATAKVIAEKLPALVETKVGKMVDDLLTDVFRSYGDLGKQIKEKIEKKLDINLQQFDMLDYNTMIAGAINNRLVTLVNEQSIKPIMELIDGTVSFLEKKEWTLSEIVEMIKEDAREYYSWETSGEISFHCEENRDNKWHVISVDIDPKKSADKCSMRFLISGKSKRIFSMKTQNHWGDKGDLTPLKVTQLSNLEHKLFRLYSAQVTVTVDETEFDNEWYSSDN